MELKYLLVFLGGTVLLVKQTDVEFRLGYGFCLLVATRQIHRGSMVPSIRLIFDFTCTKRRSIKTISCLLASSKIMVVIISSA